MSADIDRDVREALAPVLMAAWGGVLATTGVAAITLRPDPRWPMFLGAGVAMIALAVRAALRARSAA